MSIKAGRVGVNPSQVNPVDGSILSSATSGYTKQEADAKFLTQTDASSTYESKSDASAAHNALQPKTLAVPIEMLSGTKLTVESALQGLNDEKVSCNIIEIASESDIAKLKEGVNAVLFKTGILLGYAMGVADQITTSKNMRGYVVRNGNVFTGTLSDFDGATYYIIASSELTHVDVVRVIQTKRASE